MAAPSCTYTPGTATIDITAPGGIDALLDFHRRTFGDAVMRADDGADDDNDDADDDADDDAEVDTGDDDADDSDDDADSLGDKGKRAIARMKERLKNERAARRAAEQRLAEKDGEDDAAKLEREAIAKANARIKRSEIKAAAKGVLADPNDAFLYLDLDQFEVDDDGNVDEDEIADAIDDLVKKKPYLAAQGGRRFQGSAGGGAGKQSRPKQLTEADVSRLSPEQVVEARKKGQLDDLLKGTRR
jgi:hypothetical protein